MTAKSPTSLLTSFLFEIGTQGWYLPLYASSVQDDQGESRKYSKHSEQWLYNYKLSHVSGI